MARNGLRSHLSGSVPVSIAVHLVLLIVLVVVPLFDIVLPIPALAMQPYMLAAPLPPPPVYVPRPVNPTPAPAPGPAQTSWKAPDKILPEVPQVPTSYAPPDAIGEGATGVGVPDGVGPPAAVTMPLPPDPPKPQGPVRVAQLPESPRKIVDARPVYPDVARMARKEGTVILEAVLDTNGHVTQLRVIRSVPLLDQAALDAVRQWRYAPSMYYGHPVSVLMTITVRFTLGQ